MSTSAYLNFQSNATYYFSVRVFRGYSAWGWTKDVAGGIGFASSGATNAHFVGAGITRNSPFTSADGSTDIGDTCYITTGTLNQAGTGHNADPTSGLDTDGGPYYPRAAGAPGVFNNAATLLVGELTTTTSGASTMSVKLYPTGSTNYPTDPSTITWDATYSFTETNVMTQLLVWEYGGGTGVQDALRVGTTWADVIGLEVIGAPKASPAATVYEGTTVTLSQSAGLNNSTYPMSFQWYSNSVAIVNATNNTLGLSNPTTNFTANYSIVVSNYFGTLTSAVPVTVVAGVPPFFTTQPVSNITRSVYGTANFTVGVDGTPPYGIQLMHAGTNIPGAAAQTQLSLPGTATVNFGPITLADAGQYTVTATNAFGSTNSQPAGLTVFTPDAGSFEAAAAAAGAAAFWRLSETTNSDLTPNGVLLHEYMAGLNGLAPDTNNLIFGLSGPGFPGFTGLNSLAIQTYNNGNSSMINLAGMVNYSNTMTMVCWMNTAGIQNHAIMMDTGNGQAGGGGSQPFFGIDYSRGSLGSQWGSTNSIWASGLAVPAGEWVMVAMVVDANETTVYVGSTNQALQSVTRSSVEGTNYSNTTGYLPAGRLALGRTDWSWAQYNNAWGGQSAMFTDAAVFYKALSPSTITNLFMTGVGLQVSGTPDGAGNLNLNWMPGLTLQEATSLSGPWTDVAGSPTPPYSVPISATTIQHYYRVRQ